MPPAHIYIYIKRQRERVTEGERETAEAWVLRAKSSPGGLVSSIEV